MIVLKIIIIMTIFVSCNPNSKSYEVIATTNNLRDSTQVFIASQTNSNFIDSTYIINNKFYFKGEINKSPERFLIYTKGFKQYRFVWFENTVIDFNASKSSFRNAIISGSKTQKLNDILSNSLTEMDWVENVNVLNTFIKTHNSSPLTSFYLSAYKQKIPKIKVTELYSLLNKPQKESYDGKEIKQFLSISKEIKIGDRFTDFSLSDQNGIAQSLSDHIGKLTLLEFWASWCSPCLETNPELVKIYNRQKNNGFNIFAVSLDRDLKSWNHQIKNGNLNWTHVSDLKDSRNFASLIYNVTKLPMNFLIDSNSIIIAKNVKISDLESVITKNLSLK